MSHYMQAAQASSMMLLGLVGTGMLFKSAIYYVEPGHRAFKFNAISGVKENVFREGWHFRIPVIEKPIVYDIRARPKTIKSATGSKDLQTVNLSLRLMYKPNENRIFQIYRELGKDYDARVLPSVVNEVLRSVVARYTAAQLAHQREQVSSKIRVTLAERLRDFYIELDDVSITELGFSQVYQNAVEAK